MEALAGIRRDRFPSTAVLRMCAPSVAWLGVCLFLAMAVLLAVRRWSGGLQVPLPTAALVAVALGLAAMAALVRWSLHHSSHTPGPPRKLRSNFGTGCYVSVSMLLSISFLTLAWAISLAGTTSVGLLVLWSVAIADTAHLAVVALLRTRRPASGGAPQPSVAAPQQVSDVGIGQADIDLPQDVSQQVRRGRTGDGLDCCYGWARCVFDPGQRAEAVHVSFCPPFSATPKMAVHQRDGARAQIKTAQLLPYGSRLEIRLDQVHNKQVELIIEFAAVEAGETVAAG